MKDFRSLQVWQKARRLTLLAYDVTRRFPKGQDYGFNESDTKMGASIGANIAEGCGKRGHAEFQDFWVYRPGSASELEYHFLLAHDLGFVDDNDYEILNKSVVEGKRMLASLVRKVEQERLGG